MAEMPELGASWGDEGVRLTKLARATGDLLDLTMWVSLVGRRDFGPGAPDPLGRRVRAGMDTGSIADTILKLADAQDFVSPEELAVAAARELWADRRDVEEAHVRFERAMWRRMTVSGRLRSDAFVHRTSECHTGSVRVDSSGVSVTAGVEGLGLLRLRPGPADSDDRRDPHVCGGDHVLATTLSAEWRYDGSVDDYMDTWRGIRREITESFARGPKAESASSTVSGIGGAVLCKFPAVATITVRMPTFGYSRVAHSPTDLGAEPTSSGPSSGAVLRPADDPVGIEEATFVR